MERLFEMDGQLLLWIREVFASPVMDKIMIFISSLANKGMLWIGIGVVLLLLGVKGRKWSNRGLLVLLSLAFNMVICNLLLKPLVARTRPYDLLGYEILVRRLGDYSFPSGHTSASFAAATAIYAIDRRWGAAAYVLAALILGMLFYILLFSRRILLVFSTFFGVLSRMIAGLFRLILMPAGKSVKKLRKMVRKALKKKIKQVRMVIVKK